MVTLHNMPMALIVCMAGADLAAALLCSGGVMLLPLYFRVTRCRTYTATDTKGARIAFMDK